MQQRNLSCYCHVVKCDCCIVCKNTYLSCLFLRNWIKACFYTRKSLVEKSGFNWVLGCIKQKYKSRFYCLLLYKISRSSQLISPKLKFRSLFSIVSDPVLVQWAEIKGWNIVLKQTEIASCDPTSLRKLEMRIDIGFTSAASKRTIDVFKLVYDWNLL